MKKTDWSIESICKTWNQMSLLLISILLLQIMFTGKTSFDNLIRCIFWITYGSLLLSQLTINIFFVKEINKREVVLLTCSLLLLIAVTSLPYIYYSFLRVTITVVASINAFELYKQKKYLLLSIFIVIIILFNPINIIHLEKATWARINLITSLFFGVYVAFFIEEVDEEVDMVK